MEHKIANAGHEDEAAVTTRSFSHHGLSKRARRVKKVRNRAAKRAEGRRARREEEVQMGNDMILWNW